MSDELREKIAQDRAEVAFKEKQFAGDELDEELEGGILVLGHMTTKGNEKKDTKAGETKDKQENLTGDDSMRNGESGADDETNR